MDESGGHLANFAAVAVGKTSVKTWADRNTGNTYTPRICIGPPGIQTEAYTKASLSTIVKGQVVIEPL